MNILGFEVRTDMCGRINLHDIHKVAEGLVYNVDVSVEEFLSSKEIQMFTSQFISCDYLVFVEFVDKIIVLSFCNKISIRFMFDVYYSYDFKPYR